MVHYDLHDFDTQNYCFFFLLCPSSSILQIKKHNVLDLWNPQVKEEDTYSVGSLSKS
jgi:hypothetical protein